MEPALHRTYPPGQIRKGLPYDALEGLMGLLGLSLREIAGLLLISERTLARRRRQGHFTQAESDRLVRLRRLVEEAVDAFDGHREEAVEWLRMPKTLLSGETPLQHADTEPGLRAVEDMLSVIQYNVAA